MPICSQGSLGVPTLHAGVPIAGTLLSAGCREGNWHNSPQSKSSSEALSWVPSCWERLALSHDELVLSLGDPSAMGYSITQHCSAPPRRSNPRLGHQDHGKCFPCTQPLHSTQPHRQARGVPVPALAGQGASRVGCQRWAAGPGSWPAWLVLSTGDSVTLGTRCQHSLHSPTGTVSTGVPPPALGPCPQFSGVSPQAGHCLGASGMWPTCTSPTATGEAGWRCLSPGECLAASGR